MPLNVRHLPLAGTFKVYLSGRPLQPLLSDHVNGMETRPMDMMLDARQTFETAIRTRAEQDPAFRDMILTDTKALLEEVFGAQEMPALQLRIIEEQPGEVVLVLPAAPTEARDELSAQDLDQVSGGMPSQAEIMAFLNSPARQAAIEALISHVNNAAFGRSSFIGNVR
jgi:hypothetical protein